MYTNLLNSSHFNHRLGDVIYQFDSFRYYALMFQEAYSRSRVWNELTPEEWVRGKAGGPSIFFKDRGRPSKRQLGFGSLPALVTTRFDEFTSLTEIDVDVDLPEGLSDEELDDLVANAARVLCTELVEGHVELDRLASDSLRIDWFGLEVLMVMVRGDRPSLSISMRPANAKVVSPLTA